MTTPPTSSNIQNWSDEQWKQVLQKGAFRGLNVHRLAKANLNNKDAKINYDKNANTISIGKIVVKLDKLQKKTGFSLHRCFSLCFRSKKTKEIDAKMIDLLAHSIRTELLPEEIPSESILNSPSENEPGKLLSALYKNKHIANLDWGPPIEPEIDEKTKAFENAHSIINKWYLQEIYENVDTAALLGSDQPQPEKPISKDPKITKEEYEAARRLLETEEAALYTKRKLSVLNDIYKNKDTTKIIDQK